MAATGTPAPALPAAAPRARLHPLLRAALYLAGWLPAQLFAVFTLMFVMAIVTFAQSREVEGPAAQEQFAEAMRAALGQPAYLVTAVVASALGVLLWTYLAMHLFEGRPLRSLGLQRVPGWLRQLGLGVVLGLAFNAVMAAVLVATGHLTIAGLSPAFGLSGLLLGVGMFTAVSVLEEVSMRGYLLQVIAQWRGLRVGVIASTLVFGSLHIANTFVRIDEATGDAALGAPVDAAQALVGLLVIVAAGFLLAYAYVVTQQLWLPIGLHFAWNFGMGTLLGFPVSNFPLPFPALLESQVAGHGLLTGGAFGLEGSVLALPVILLVALFIRLAERWMNAPHPDATQK